MQLFEERRTLLHDYIPSFLPHRRQEARRLKQYLKAGAKIHVVGPVGSGKTVLCRKVCHSIAQEMKGKVKYAYVNLAFMHGPYHVMASIHRQVLGEDAAGLSPEEALTNIIDYLVGGDLKLIVILDEVDTYVLEGRSQKILYMLTRVNEVDPKAAGRLVLIYVSRSLDWIRKLNNTVLDTLGRTSIIRLEKYTEEQLRDIIAYRAELAFKPNAISEETLDFVTSLSARYGGVRYALELLLEAGIAAENDGESSVTADYVRKAHASILKAEPGRCLGKLADNEQKLLKEILKIFASTKKAFITKNAVMQQAGRHGEEPQVEAALRSLAEKGYILPDGEKIMIEYPCKSLLEAMEGNAKNL